MNTEPLLLLQERVDDVPLLWGLMQRLGLAEVLQKHLGSHHRHRGLANGTLACVWLAYILSQADHRKNAVRDWAHSLRHTLETLTDQPLRQTDFTDDRLAIVLFRLPHGRPGPLASEPPAASTPARPAPVRLGPRAVYRLGQQPTERARLRRNGRNARTTSKFWLIC
jgi:hypothetical protein